ncbi:MAG: hypothetical protein H8E41_06175 [Desulfobulbaceae bacterium]|uniref:Uncharacterized protein n=1 Tax=Candidatus Desulfobia pelagia TaxID=2841692 RepID=A0A8J6NCP6_9BACT|nr:hypothetical protein [Candidatus Desulfobia pelagia]
MAKIIQLDLTRKKPKKLHPEQSIGCEHNHVIAYTVHRTVCCAACETLLDPFDVLVDMLKSYVPPCGDDLNEKRLDKEVERRRRERRKDPQG